MIVEVICGSVSVIFVSSLVFVASIIDKQNKADADLDLQEELKNAPPDIEKHPALLAIKEKRRVIERDRQEWLNTKWKRDHPKFNYMFECLKEDDEKLIELADEEMKIRMELTKGQK